ncbi:MAG: EAL domain-containing protein [Halomonadaceae bacterium]|nr:MAG: EAL domain-containing protein [Halomonadaceae bacterium]
MQQAVDIPGNRLRQWLPGLILFLLLALTSSLLLLPGSLVPAIWLPLGIAVAWLLQGRILWLIPILAGNLFSQWLWLIPAPDSNYPAIFAAAIILTLEPLFIVQLHSQLVRQPDATMRHQPAFVRLLAVATVAVAMAALALTWLLYRQGDEALSTVFLQLWLGHMLGLVLLTPLILNHPSQWLSGIAEPQWMEIILWLTSLALAVMVFINQPPESLLLLLPWMLWVVTRFPLPLVVPGLMLTTLIGLWLLQAGDGNPLLQALLLVMAGSASYLHSLLTDRNELTRRLDGMVQDSNLQLQQKNQQLQDEIYVRKQAEKAFRRSTRHYRALVETASNPILVTDAHARIRQWNSAAEILFGYSREDAMGRNLLTTFIPEVYRDELGWKITKVLQSGVPREHAEIQINGIDGEQRSILWNLTRLEDEDETVETQAILIGQDISEIRQTQDQLHYLAHYDILTGTANRRLFEDRCRQAIERALRYRHRCALISLDVDHFKRINDTLGHDAGDALLKVMTQRLQEMVRGEDTIARLGGDEFAVLLSQVTGPEGCEKVARNLLENLTRPVSVPGGELVITSSIGITIAPDDGSTYEDLLKNADMAMYRAKKAGRNTIEFFSPDMNADMQHQMRIERELRQAIREGDLDLHYQPVVDLNNGEVVTMEALLRWNHAKDGLLPPSRFLDIAEQTGQLLAIGEWVCYNACLQARVIQTLSEYPVPVSINLSARQYQHPQLISTLQRVMAETRVDPSLLCVEVDERILADRMDDAAKVLMQIKTLGITLVLDRFGSGLSSIRLLRELPFDEVKIDRSLISQVPSDSSACAIVATLVDLARQMNLRIIASGVETNEQLQFLQSVNCRLGQGHRFCAAIPSARLGELFQKVRAGDAFATCNQFDLLDTPPGASREKPME